MATLDRASTRGVIPADIYRLATLYDAPAYVKQASATELLGDDQVPLTGYAGIARRDWPIHTKAATWLSAVRLADAGGADDRGVADRVEHAVGIWGIGWDLRRSVAKAAMAYEAATSVPTPDDYAFVDAQGDCRLPVRTAAEAVKAAQWFTRYRDRFRYADRAQIAERILVKAASLGADLGDAGDPCERTAGWGRCDSDRVQAFLLDRAGHAQAAKRADAADLYLEIAHLAPTWDDAGDFTKLAAAVDELDRDCGLAARYGQDVALPEEVLCAVTAKVAGDWRDNVVELASGTAYQLDDLLALRADDLAATLGPAVVAEVSRDGFHVNRAKLAAALPRWDGDQARRWDWLVAARGVAPILRSAVQASQGLSRRDLTLLAD